MNKKGKYYELYNQGNLNNYGLKKKKVLFMNLLILLKIDYMKFL